jgi:DNA topoisomerase-1
VLEIGANRAIDLIAAKESGASSRFGGDSGRPLGDHPTLGGAVSVRRGRFGVYVNHGKVNATLPRGTNPETVTLEEALATLAAKASGGPGGRAIGEHPDGGPITLRAGRFGAYVNWGKVNATIPKSTPPDSITLAEALELLAEREGRPVRKGKALAKKTAAKAKKPAKTKEPAAPPKAAARTATAKKTATKTAPAKKPPAKKAAAKSKRSA